MSKIVRTYRFALDPSAAQELALRSHCGAQRFAHNWGLARVGRDGLTPSATMSLPSGRWFVSIPAEITRNDGVVGVDLGVKSLAVLSTGETVANPKHLNVVPRTLRRVRRQAARRAGPDKRTAVRPSNRWRKTQARIAMPHARVANARARSLERRHGDASAHDTCLPVS